MKQITKLIIELACLYIAIGFCLSAVCYLAWRAVRAINGF